MKDEVVNAVRVGSDFEPRSSNLEARTSDLLLEERDA
jgi:hypothetical protein